MEIFANYDTEPSIVDVTYLGCMSLSQEEVRQAKSCLFYRLLTAQIVRAEEFQVDVFNWCLTPHKSKQLATSFVFPTGSLCRANRVHAEWETLFDAAARDGQAAATQLLSERGQTAAVF